jgi:hypothetical protein
MFYFVTLPLYKSSLEQRDNVACVCHLSNSIVNSGTVLSLLFLRAREGQLPTSNVKENDKAKCYKNKDVIISILLIMFCICNLR